MRSAFEGLTSNLIDQLAGEARRKVLAALQAKAQVAVDILVRNLFERTADIGFLATDADLRRFAESAGADRDLERRTIVERLRAYQHSYTVYDDVVLLDPAGEVLARLAPREVMSTEDPFVAEAARGTAPYVEAFGRFMLLPDAARSLVYAHRLLSSDGERGVGVLCLSFAFDDECRRIFDGLRRAGDWSVLALVDTAGRVIASSDALLLAPGVQLDLGSGPGTRTLRFGGRRWLATQCAAHPYQGYAGPGWLGVALVPLDLAFDTGDGADSPDLSPGQLTALSGSPLLYSDGLRAIPPAAAAIEADLQRAVWNGRVALCSAPADRDGAFAKALLREIGQTGARTRQVFTRAITELNQTVVSALLDATATRAALAIDILDRNLYERSNDCRWWALSGVFRSTLESGPVDAAGRLALTRVLQSIHRLYTVYADLLLFDRDGRVVATSREDSSALAGRPLDAEWVARTLVLGDPRDWTVSAFEPSPLYDGRPTCIFAAAVRGAGDPHRVVGGIAIVFDAAPQFEAMLVDTLPRGEAGAVPEGAVNLFVDATGRVLATSGGGGPAVGETLAGGAELAAAREAAIVERDGRHCAFAAQASSGYREYRSGRDPRGLAVSAVCIVPLASATGAAPVSHAAAPSWPRRSAGDGDRLDLASFRVAGQWYALRGTEVLEAIGGCRVLSLPSLGACVRGSVMHGARPVLVVDLARLLGVASAADEGGSIVVVRGGETFRSFGLWVDALGDNPEIACAAVQPLGGPTSLIDSVVRPGPSAPAQELLRLLSLPNVAAAAFGSRAIGRAA